MRKSVLALSLIALGLSAFAGEKIAEYTLPNVNAELIESTAWPDRSYIAVDDGEYISPYEPEGAPQIPYRVLQFAIPDGYDVKSVSAEVEAWTTLSENVRVMPIQPPIPTNTPEGTIPEFVELDPTYMVLGGYPMTPAEKLSTYTQNGIELVSVKATPFRWNPMTRLLERAKNMRVIVTFSQKPPLVTTMSVSNEQPKKVVNPVFQNWTRASVVNPRDLPPQLMQMMAVDDSKQILLIVAPHDLYEDWKWYAEERAKNHPDISFDVVDTATIYAKYPYRNVRVPAEGPITDLKDSESRYPCESIWKWLVDYRSQHNNLHYVVLGGMWLDVTDPVVHYMHDGTEVTVNNAVPSVRAVMRNDIADPTDMYFACLDKESGDTPHHWDENNNGTYLEGGRDENGQTIMEYSHCSMTPVIAVSRITAKPMTMAATVEFNPEFERSGQVLNQHQIISNMLWKVQKTEKSDFRGNFKLCLTSSPLSYSARYLNDGLMVRDEIEFFDRAPNMYAPEHTDNFRDCEPTVRRQGSELTATRRPVIDAISFHEPSTVSANATAKTFSADMAAFDREIGVVFGHGWAGGSGFFSATHFSTCASMTRINVVGISCETGYLDIYGNQNGKSVANLCLGESGTANVTASGGFIASVNNTRLGWTTFECDTYRGRALSHVLHYHMINGVENGMTAGDAWLNMALRYLGKTGNHINSTGGQCYTEEMLFGDPLIKLEEISNHAWDGGTSGDWNFGTVDAATFNTTDSTTVNVAPQDEVNTPYGAMSVAITQNAGDTFKFTGDGALKVMRGIAVSGGNLEIGIQGGQGGAVTYDESSEKNTAKRENYLQFTNTGTVTFNDISEDAYFFVNGIKNASQVTFAGAGAIINTDEFDDELNGLVFQGPNDFDPRTAPANVIRANLSKNVGALARFMPFTLNNSALALETHDAFNGYAGEIFMTLNNSVLKFRENRWRGLIDQEYFEKVRGKLYLNSSTLVADYPCNVYLKEPTIEVTGNSSIETTNKGKFKLDGITTIVLKDSATITINADFEVLEGGGIEIIGSGRAIIANAKGLVGTVSIGGGVTLELEEIPLPEVTELALADGAKIVLPHVEGNFYQILPLTSALTVEDDATIEVYSKLDGVETKIDAELTQTGAIFESGTLLEWSDKEGTWSEDPFAKPWIKNGIRMSFDPAERAYFPDLRNASGIVPEAHVSVAETIESPFTCFANKETAYIFSRSAMESAQSATITFDSLVIGGETYFNLPTFYKTRLYVSGGYFAGTDVTTPLIEVAKGGVLEAESIATPTIALTEVRVEEGGVLVLTGDHAMNLTLETGAILKPVVGKSLTWNDSTFVNWPTDSKIMVDVSEWEATDNLVPIIEGVNADMALLSRMEVSDNKVTLAIDGDGDICLVRCDTDASPFTLDMTDETTDWDTDNWYANGTKFAKKWSESYPNWLATGEITVSQDGAELDLNVGAHFDTLAFKTDLENANVKLILGEGGELLAKEVSFAGFAKAEITNLELGTGVLTAATDTHIHGKWSGVLNAIGDDTIYIYDPEEPWMLAEGIQGTIYVGVTSRARAERQKIIKIKEDSDWPIGGLTVKAFDPATGAEREDCMIVREGEWVYLVPPPPTAHAPQGENDWSELTWIAYDNAEVTIEDWRNIYWAKIVSDDDGAVVVMDGGPSTRLTIGAGNKLTLKAKDADPINIPKELEVNAEVTIKGAILPMLEYAAGEGKLILDTGDITEIIIPGSVMPIDEKTYVEVKAGSTLRFAHQTYFQKKEANFSRITGEGTLEIKDISGVSSRFIMPNSNVMFSRDLSFVLNTTLELQTSHKTNPLEVSNLSGSGTFGFGEMTIDRMLKMINSAPYNGNIIAFGKDYAGTRVLRTRQTKVTEWTNTLPTWFGLPFFSVVFDSKLIVAGEGSASFDHRLIYSGIASNAYRGGSSANGDYGNNHDLEIESTGCFELNGYWNGKITNNGILVLGRRKQIIPKTDYTGTGFEGSGRIATLGDKIDLTAFPVFKTQYALASGTYGEIDFTVSDFDSNEAVMRVESNFALHESENLILVAEKDGEHQYQIATADNIKNGQLVWLGNKGESSGDIELDLAPGDDNDMNALIGDKFLGVAPKLVVNGDSDGTSYLDATSQIGSFVGELTLNNATMKCVSPLTSTLHSEPVGKLVFVVEDLTKELVLMNLPDGFTYNPEDFTVEVVGTDGEAVDAYWTWTTQDKVLKYILTNPATSAYMPRAFRFDGNLAGWGSNSVNLGNATPDKFVDSRAGQAITDHNPYGDKFEIGTNDWSISWVARLSAKEGGNHFALGTKDGGGVALSTVNAGCATISRWTGSGDAVKLIEGNVPFATTRFNAYALTYRKGLYTFYINGEKVGEAKELEDAPAYPETINWQIFSVHGGNPGGTTHGTDGAIDDFRLYNVAIGETMVKAIADEFKPWPDDTNADGGEIYVDVNDAGVKLYFAGSGIIHLTHRKGEPGIAYADGLSGDAKIIIEDGVELIVEMSASNRIPLSGRQVEIKKGGRLVLKQTTNMIADGENFASAAVNLSNITGAGTIELRSDNLKYKLRLASSRKSSIVDARYWDKNLSVCINTQIELYSSYNENYPLILRNLSGNGSFYHVGDKELNYIEIIQTERTAWTGSFPKEARVKIVGEGVEPSTKAAFVLMPKKALPNGFEITTAENAVLGITSNANLDNVKITNNGLVLLEPSSYETIDLTEFNFALQTGNKIVLSGSGILQVEKETTGFVLQANPLGTLWVTDVEENPTGTSIINVAPGFVYDPTKFRVVFGEGKRVATPSVEGNVLKIGKLRSRPPRIIVR